MIKIWYTPEGFPESRFRIRPLDNARHWDLKHSNMKAAALQEIFHFAVTDWENAPVFAKKDEVFEKYEEVQIPNIDMDCVLDVVLKARELSALTDEEIKNLESQST